MKRVIVSWSGGKDSALAMHRLWQDPDVEVAALLTVFDDAVERAIMTMIRRSLVRKQAAMIGMPLREADVATGSNIGEYVALMERVTRGLIKDGFTHIAFGDVHSEETRRYRENNLRDTALQPLFPLWGTPPRDLAHELFDAGFKARVVSVDPQRVDVACVGREFNAAFLDELPAEVDPVGENGEFHTFVTQGPIFKAAIPINVGPRIMHQGYWYVDVYPAE